MLLKITWKEVFDCKVWHGHINKIVDGAYKNGYHYFSWNGRVYQILPNEITGFLDSKDTGILSKDLDPIESTIK